MDLAVFGFIPLCIQKQILRVKQFLDLPSVELWAVGDSLYLISLVSIGIVGIILQKYDSPRPHPPQPTPQPRPANPF